MNKSNLLAGLRSPMTRLFYAILPFAVWMVLLINYEGVPTSRLILPILAVFAVITVSTYLVLTTLNYFATNWEEKSVRVYGFVSAIWVIGSSSSYFWVIAPSWRNMKHMHSNLIEISLMAFGPVICVIALKVIYEKYIR